MLRELATNRALVMSRIADAPVGGELDRAPTNRFAHCRVSHVLRLRRKNAFVCMFIFT